MKVVNLRFNPFDQYIGRPGKGQDGYFGNPFVIGKDGDRDTVIALYREYFYLRIKVDPEFKRRVEELRGKVLGCFCAGKGGLTALDKPFTCHGQIILEYLMETRAAA
jgi:hypothetical protein